MALTHTQLLKAALPYTGNASRLAWDEARLRVQSDHLQNLFFEGSRDIPLDADHGSLQWRVLGYLKQKGWVVKPESKLKQAWESAKRASAREARKAFLGGSDPEKISQFKKRNISLMELFLCHQAVVDVHFSNPFNAADFRDLLNQKFRSGQGLEFLDFLIRLRKNALRRKIPEKINPHTVVMALLWTSESTPLWILPAKAIANVVAGMLALKKPPTPQSINAAIRDGELFHLPSVTLDKFYSKNIDTLGGALHRELFETTGYDFSQSFRGRPKTH